MSFIDNPKILAINPGSTSTKIAVFQGTKSIFLKNIKHTTNELKRFKKITDQFEYRKKIIIEELHHAEIEITEIAAVIGRGGLVKPIESGVYEINERMKSDLCNSPLGEHASNLGGLIADDIAKAIPGARAYIVDPIVVDELQNVARITGHPMFEKVSIFHALNQKAIARSYAQSIDKKYEDLRLIIAHLGGGISVGAHKGGRVIDVNNGLNGDGPFSPERSGGLPAAALAKLCFSGKYKWEEVEKMITGQGGYVAYLGTNDAYEVETRAQKGDKMARLIEDALCYQVGKEIGALSTVLEGMVDAIILTGGMAHNTYLVEYIQKMTAFIAPVVVYPGEDEMKALAMNGHYILTGKVQPRIYQ